MSLTEVLRKALADTDPLYPIAKATGVSYSVLYRFSTGERDITLRTADKLAAHFQLELRPIRKPRSK
ncbi:MAG: helix-turn-helix domain-containing protein [Pirellulaceae bacterium]